MHTPIEHEQAYTPPPPDDTITDGTTADGTGIIDNADAPGVGEQTTTDQPRTTLTAQQILNNLNPGH
ncbi:MULTISPECIES: hypothetical protein [unclassified Actinomyces]|uniref:hypothetical protein n=1 Tax=unclassified Actinomyces TaxID=2609248 RepID=UPI000D5A067C|nr:MULTISPECIES: hypothetical protein [unclassified Actinomyces]RAX24367.1 hypothetical protein DRB07_01260 [Actinomyces sp. Z3]